MNVKVGTWTGAVLLVGMMARLSSAQVTPAAGYTPPDDTPSIKVGVTLFPMFNLQSDPKVTDGNGNAVSRNTFDVGRAYINVTGNVSHLVSFRLTPDITRQSGLLSLGAGNSVANDSLVYRIKYAYGQFGLDDWMTKGSWVRLGIQQTPWVDYDEGIYRYRFQGTVFAERVPLPTAMSSSDAGVSFHYNLPSNFGDVHVGLYNGENYSRVEVNNQKSFQFRGTLRPFARNAPVLRGLRVHVVDYADHYVGNATRTRFMTNVTYEHKFLNAEVDYLRAKDQSLASAAIVESQGWAFWATPKLPMKNGASLEGLIRYDHWTPNTGSALAPAGTAALPGTTLLSDQHQNRAIVGGAYWFPHEGNVSTALLLDWDAQKLVSLSTKPTKVLSVHGLITF